MNFARRVSGYPLLLLFFSVICTQAYSVVTINIREMGPDVEVSFAGSIDLTGLEEGDSIAIASELAPQAGFIVCVPDDANVASYVSPAPVNFPFFGEGSSEAGELFIEGGIGEGEPFGLGYKTVFVPQSYTSREHLSGSARYTNRSLESLRLQPGVYTAVVPNDIVVMVVGSGLVSKTTAPDPLPEPEPAPVPVPDPDPEPEPEPAPVQGANQLVNGDFESGLSHWSIYNDGRGEGIASGPGFGGSSQGFNLSILSKGSNMQLFQNDIVLEPKTDYELTFHAYSNTGHNLRVAISKHSSPYTNYGMNRVNVELTKEWKLHKLRFTTAGFKTVVKNARLYFWFSKDGRNGDQYFIDDVTLVKANR